jgi:hypothetical protein
MTDKRSDRVGREEGETEAEAERRRGRGRGRHQRGAEARGRSGRVEGKRLRWVGMAKPAARPGPARPGPGEARPKTGPGLLSQRA